MQQYYDILQITSSAKLEEVKKAYRKRAKELHPDLNPDPDASDRFILLHEAYEFLINKKTGAVYNERAKTYTKTRNRYKSYKEWEKKEKKKAQGRAHQYANMRWRSFEETRVYQSAQVIAFVLNYVYLLLGCMMVIVPPTVTMIRGDLNVLRFVAMFGSTLIGVGLIVAFWKETMGNFFKLKWERP